MRQALPSQSSLSILLQMIVAAAAAREERGGFPPPRSALLINLLAAGAHAAHIYIFSSRLWECGTEVLAQIS